MSDAVRPISLNLDIPRAIFSGWLAAITVLVVVILFRQSAAPDNFKAASIDSTRLVTDVRKLVSSSADYPDLVEVEVIEFLKFVQIELDDLSKTEGVSIVVTSESVLSGNFVNYTDYVFLHAKDAYEAALLTRDSYAQKRSVPLASISGDKG